MRDFGRADAERIGAECAVRRRVAVAADDQQPGQGQSLFGPDDMHDALARVAQAEQRDVIVAGIGLEIAHHRRDLGIGNAAGAAARRHVVIGDPEGESRLCDTRVRALSSG